MKKISSPNGFTGEQCQVCKEKTLLVSIDGPQYHTVLGVPKITPRFSDLLDGSTGPRSHTHTYIFLKTANYTKAKAVCISIIYQGILLDSNNLGFLLGSL